MRKGRWHSVSAIAVLLAGLFCCQAATGETKGAGLGKIEAGKPRYVRKDHEAWKSKGRIVGIARETPEFKVRILDTSKQEVKTTTAEKLNDWYRTPGMERLAAQGLPDDCGAICAKPAR